MRAKRIGLAVVGLLAAVIAGLAGLGWATPREHTVVVESQFEAPIDDVYRAISTPEAYPSWRTGVSAVVRSAPARFLETSDGDTIAYAIEEAQPPRRWVTRIDDPSLPFGGRWTHELTATPGGGTQLRSTEEGYIDNVVVRGLARLLMDPRASLASFHTDLQNRRKG